MVTSPGLAGIVGPSRACWDSEAVQGMLGRVPGLLPVPVSRLLRRGPNSCVVKHRADLIKSSLHQHIPINRQTHAQILQSRSSFCFPDTGPGNSGQLRDLHVCDHQVQFLSGLFHILVN